MSVTELCHCRINVGLYNSCVFTRDVRFSIPLTRVKGFRSVLAETNDAAKAEGFKVIRPHRAGSSNEQQHYLLRVKNRREILISELFGYIQDAMNGRRFKRTAGSREYW
jgi:hypothetical protein